MTNYIVIAKFWSDGETHAGTLCGRRIFKARAPPSHLHSSYLEYVQGPVNVFLDTEIEAQVTRWTNGPCPLSRSYSQRRSGIIRGSSWQCDANPRDAAAVLERNLASQS